MRSTIIAFAALAAVATAKTDIGGCSSSATTNSYGEASVLYYIPGSCEICEILDCGGGRAPPKTTVPGCAAYSGTLTYTPSFLTACGGQSVISSTSIPTAVVPTGSSSSFSLSTSGPIPTVIVSNPTATIISNGTSLITAAPTSISTSTVAGNGTVSTSTRPFTSSTTAPSGSSSGASVVTMANGLMALVAAGAAFFL